MASDWQGIQSCCLFFEQRQIIVDDFQGPIAKSLPGRVANVDLDKETQRTGLELRD